MRNYLAVVLLFSVNPGSANRRAFEVAARGKHQTMNLKFVREYFTYWLTRSKTETVHMGIRLSLRKASKRVRYSLLKDYEREDAELCSALLSPGDQVLEVGSAIGFVALYCRKQLGISDIAMVEANPDLLDVLEENFRLNGLPPPRF